MEVEEKAFEFEQFADEDEVVNKSDEEEEESENDVHNQTPMDIIKEQPEEEDHEEPSQENPDILGTEEKYLNEIVQDVENFDRN